MNLIKFIILHKKFHYREIIGEAISDLLFVAIQFSFFTNFIISRNDFNNISFFTYIIFSFIICSCCFIPITEKFCNEYYKKQLYKKYLFCRSYFGHLVSRYFLDKVLTLLFFFCSIFKYCNSNTINFNKQFKKFPHIFNFSFAIIFIIYFFAPDNYFICN